MIYLGNAIGPKGVGSGICVGKPGPRFFRSGYSAFGGKDVSAFTSAMTFSNNFTTATAGAGGNGNHFVRNTTGHLPNGVRKYQAELTCAGAGPFSFGVADMQYPYKAGSANTIDFLPIFIGIVGGSASIQANLSGTNTLIGAATAPAAGDVIGVVLDEVAQTVTIYLNGTPQATPVSVTPLTTGNFGQPTLLLAMGLGRGTAASGTLNTGATAFAFPVAGASPWK